MLDVHQRIERAVDELGDPYLIRAQLSRPRIKSASSLRRKAQEQGWTFEQALSKAQDLVGFRLVCHNLQDVRRVVDLIYTSLRQDGFIVQRDDYSTKPKKDGYRAIHLLFQLPVRIGDDEAKLGCEIQIRSLLQDAWAQLSRVDVYSGEADLPRSVARRMATLSEQLARADGLADKVRTNIARPRRGRRPQSGQPLTAPALAFLFRSRFSKEAPDYLVQSLLREAEGRRLRSDGLEVVLRDDTFLDNLEKAYASACGWTAEPEQLFRWAVLSLFLGTDGAVRRARSEGTAEYKEIEVFARREILSEVPKVDDILNALENAQKDEDPGFSLELWANALGASNACAFCGTTIIDPDAFGDAAVRHYKLRGKKAESVRDRLAEAARSTAVETGSWSSSTVCSYCDHVLGKD